MTSQSDVDLELDRLRAELIDFVLRETGNRLASDGLLWNQLLNRLNDPDFADRIVVSPAFSALADRIAAQVVATSPDKTGKKDAPQPQAEADKELGLDPESPDPQGDPPPGSGPPATGLFSGLSRRAWVVMGLVLLLVAAISAAAGWGISSGQPPEAVPVKIKSK